jgi:hypothetical protein
MLHKRLLAAALLSGVAFASVAEAGHNEPTIRLGVDMVWGGGHFYPAPVAWYPPPVYSYAPPPAYGRPGWARGGHHRHDHRHHHYRHHDYYRHQDHAARHEDRHDGRHDRWHDDD